MSVIKLKSIKGEVPLSIPVEDGRHAAALEHAQAMVDSGDFMFADESSQQWVLDAIDTEAAAQLAAAEAEEARVKEAAEQVKALQAQKASAAKKTKVLVREQAKEQAKAEKAAAKVEAEATTSGDGA